MSEILVGLSGSGQGNSFNVTGANQWGISLVPDLDQSVSLNPLSPAFNYFEGVGLFLGGLGAEIKEGLEYLTQINPNGSAVHIHVPHNQGDWSEFFKTLAGQLREKQFKVVLVIGAEEDSWECPNRVDETVGLAPAQYREERKQVLLNLVGEVKKLRDQGLDIEAINGHLGSFHKLEQGDYQECVQSVQEVVVACRAAGIRLGVETGPEPVDKLIRFFRDVDPDTAGQAPVLVANFDPANIVLYGSGEPFAVLQQLHEAGRLGSMHLKNAKKKTDAADDGSEWRGTEVPLEAGGDADLVRCMQYVYATSKLDWINAVRRGSDKVEKPLGFSTVIERELDSPDQTDQKLPGMQISLGRVRVLIGLFGQESIGELEYWARGHAYLSKNALGVDHDLQTK